MTETTTDTEMKTTPTPAEELRAAATKLREAAKDADKSSWYSAEDFAHSLCESDVSWLTLMHPGLAEPMAVWLERLADIIAEIERVMGPQDFKGSNVEAALKVARVINGTAS